MLLALAGALLGMLAARFTDAALVWRRPPSLAATEHVLPEPLDQGEAGRSWARAAFDGGLRKCPEMNSAFVAACAAEMKALAERPLLAPGSYGGPLLITKVEPVPEPRYEEDLSLPPPEPLPNAEPEIAAAPMLLAGADEPTPDNYPAQALRD